MNPSLFDVISNAIASLTRAAKQIRLKQVFLVIVAGFFVLTSTACRSTPYTQASNVEAVELRSANPTNPYDKDTGPQHELYKATQRPEQGMNNYNDDARYDHDATQAETQKLIKRVEKNLKNRATNPGDVVENVQKRNPIGEKARDFSRNLGEKTEQLKEDVAEGTQQGIENLKNNIGNAKDNAPKVFEEAKQTAIDADRDAKAGARDLSKGMQRVTERAADAVQNRA
jgi:ElaB/YqjD/DUF883 family membrane-anchored ribosome-binding protein